MKYLVDSDVLIDALNGRSDVIEWLRQHSDDGLAISIISLGEIYDGAVSSPDPERHVTDAQGFLAPFLALQLSDAIMLQFARLRVDLRGQGQLIPDFDLLIAATALTHDLVVVTRNERHFQRIPGLALHQD